MNEPDAVAVILQLLQQSDTFSGDHALYKLVRFIRAFPTGENVAEPTVALWQVGGDGKDEGLGTLRKYRQMRLRLDVLAGTELECQRIYQHIRETIIDDQDTPNSFLIDGGVKRVDVGEPHGVAPWDEEGQAQHLPCDLMVTIKD